MTNRVIAGAVVIASIAAAVIVELNGHDPNQYVSLATLGAGYLFGHAVGKAQNEN